MGCITIKQTGQYDPLMFSRYLDPRNDVAFRKIFGMEKHKRIPIAFLNSVFNLTGVHEIVDLEFLNPIQNPELRAKKESIVDVLVRDQKGDKYIIEMQVSKVAGFQKRAQYYASKAYINLFDRGDDYHLLRKVIFLAITNHVVFPDKAEYKSNHKTLDEATYENDLEDLKFTFIELPKFNKQLEDLKTVEEKWYFFLKHAKEPEDMAQLIQTSPEIKEAYEILDRFHWSPEELQAYDDTFMAEADYRGALIAAQEDGKAQGLAEGKAEGKAKGLAEGMEAKALAIAKSMRAKGIPLDVIVEVTGLTEDLILR